MQLSLLRKSFILLLFVTFFCVSCGGFKFENSSTSQSASTSLANIAKEKVKVMTAFPEDMDYIVLGKCKGSSYKGYCQSVDGSYDAYKRLKDCACNNGGNAVVITNKIEYKQNDYSDIKYRIPITAQQSKIQLVGTVIYIKPNQYY